MKSKGDCGLDQNLPLFFFFFLEKQSGQNLLFSTCVGKGVEMEEWNSHRGSQSHQYPV